ncbi:hypothetical protein BDZ91DRAFT_852200 [Kalaharituber pfeilii]|nr:hypothetical protein BDZ91DRAFT_852200 [Kalaharituber pfeilii]
MPSTSGISLAPVRTYLRKLPAVTVLVSGLCVAFWLIELVLGLPVTWWLKLDPLNIGLRQLHRINTYPLVHLGLLHLLLNLATFVPLAERFEREIGSLKMGALLLGPLVTFPAILYLVVERGVFRGTTSVEGLSALVLTLITIDAVRTSDHHPYFNFFGQRIRTLYTPLLTLFILLLLFPFSSLLGHVCGVAIGYLYGLKYLSKMDPPEWILEKIENKIAGWGLLRVLVKFGWVGVENREEARYVWLPMVRPRWTAEEPAAGVVEQGRARAGTGTGTGTVPAPGQPGSAFVGVGRTLGS